MDANATLLLISAASIHGKVWVSFTPGADCGQTAGCCYQVPAGYL